MSKFETFLQQNAYYGDDQELIATDLAAVINPNQLEHIGQGMNARVFKSSQNNWVIKEGRWDLDLTFIKDLKLKFPRQVTNDFLQNFDLAFNPTPDLIKSQYQDYLTFCTYFGYFSPQSSYYHPDKSTIFKKQQAIRQQLKQAKDEISSTYWIKFPDTIDQIFYPHILEHNFVPDEFTLYAPSISPQNQGQHTYFIFQQFFTGQLFHDVNPAKLDHHHLLQTILFAYLTLYLRMQEQLSLDLRPRNLLTEALDWFGKTDNLMLTDSGIKMIDTRWAWDLNSSLIKRGAIIPEQILLSTRNYLLYALKKYA